MLLVSNGMKEKMIGVLPALFDKGAIFIYGGSRPSGVELASPTAPLAVVTSDGLAWNPSNTYNGLDFFADGPFFVLSGARKAIVTPLVNGLARWFRVVGPGDDGSDSFTFPRIEGDIGTIDDTSTSEMKLADQNLVLGSTFELGYFTYTIPPIVGV